MDTTTAFRSKTIWGLLIMLITWGLSRWGGINLSEETQGQLGTDLAMLAGAGLAIYGRIKASRPISGI
jgi:hypothetical protein